MGNNSHRIFLYHGFFMLQKTDFNTADGGFFIHGLADSRGCPPNICLRFGPKKP